MKEIGSEFHWIHSEETQEKLNWLPDSDDYVLTFSGRSAFQTVIADIGEIKKVYFPSYCCDSMIEPFYKAGAEIEFYEVDYRDGFNVALNIPKDCDVLVLCNYFGYHTKYPTGEIAEFKNRGGIVIEDITHSLFSEQQHQSYSDYLVASVRKWGAILCGGLCCKLIGKIKNKPQNLPEKAFVELRTAAMKMKRDYLHGSADVKKEEFLKIYNESNHFFSCGYHGKEIDEVSRRQLHSWNIDEISSQRKKNATVIHNKLQKSDWCRPLFDLEDMECPLFVPIVVFGGKRDVLRQELIKNSIYCPVHWPKPGTTCESNLYDLELSLICDQRYGESDMERILSVVNKF